MAVLDPAAPTAVLDPRDVETRTERGTGPGGQHRNKTDTKVVAIHRPSGISVAIDGRSQHANRQLALAVLAARVADVGRAEAFESQNADRRAKVGSGQRGDKVRTYRVKDDRWLDHRTGESGSVASWLSGRG